MEEEEFMAMNIDFWKKSIVNKDSIIANRDKELAQRDSIIANRDSIIAAVCAERDIAWNTISQKDKELEEYKRRYGTINGATH